MLVNVLVKLEVLIGSFLNYKSFLLFPIFTLNLSGTMVYNLTAIFLISGLSLNISTCLTHTSKFAICFLYFNFAKVKDITNIHKKKTKVFSQFLMFNIPGHLP